MKKQPTSTDIQPVHVIHLASGDLWAGAEVQIYTLTRELHKYPQLALHVVLLNEGKLADKLREEGIGVTVIDESRYSTLSILRKFLRLARNFKPSIIHTHRQKENVIGSITSALIKGCISVRTTHGASEHIPSLFHPHKFLFHLLDLMCGRYLQRKIISVSEELTEKLAGEFPRAKIATIYNGIDKQLIQTQATATVAELPGNPACCKIGIFARLVPVKRLDLFIQIADYISSQRPNEYQFFIFGDGPERQNTENLVAKMNHRDSLFMLGHVANPIPYMKTMDAILLTSDHEGLPMSLLEAVVIGTVVISPRLGGPMEVLKGFSPSLIVESRSPERYLEKLDLLKQIGFASAGEQLAAQLPEHFYSDYNARQIVKIYEGKE